MDSSYNAESQRGKLWRKAKQAPFVPLGMAGFVGAVGYGIYSYRNRGDMKTSVFVMKFRVIAQSMVVGALTIGVGISVVQKLWARTHHSAEKTDSSSH